MFCLAWMRGMGQIKTPNFRAKWQSGSICRKATPAGAAVDFSAIAPLGVLQRPRQMLNFAAESWP
jgi:hypothetical protein